MTILAYFGVGCISFGANFLAFTAFVYLVGTHWLLANLAGFVAGTVTNYFLCVRFVFASRIHTRWSIEMLLTVLVSLIGVGFETLLLYIGHDVIGLGLVIAKIFAAGVVFFWNYLARRYFVFGATKLNGRPARTDSNATSQADVEGRIRNQRL